MAIAFPPILLPSSVSFFLRNTARSAGASINGAEQVVVSGAGIWAATMQIEAGREESGLSFRGFMAAMAGRANEVEIGPFDVYTPHDVQGRRVSDEPRSAALIAQTGGLPLHDGSGFGQSETVHATLAANAALRATRITLTAAPGWTVPRPGQYFGIGARLYIATGSYRATESDPWTVDFRPPLREAATAGARVITDRPVCTMRLASDETGQLELQLRRYGAVTLDLVEAI